MEFRRREFLRTAAGALVAAPTGCAAHERSALLCPDRLAGFDLEPDLGPLPVYRWKDRAGAAVLLLHEMTGLSPGTLALAQCLGRKGYSVYLPVLFGEPGESRPIRGYFPSCASARFACSSPEGGSTIVSPLRETVGKIHKHSGAPIGIIGMCLTGAFPLALLGDEVSAAVLCQPTLPFNILFMRPVGAQKRPLGLTEAELERARQASTPLLALRYRNDTLCPRERFYALRRLMPDGAVFLQIDDPPDGHSSLTEDLHEEALGDVVSDLEVCLGVGKTRAADAAREVQGTPLSDHPERGWRAL